MKIEIRYSDADKVDVDLQEIAERTAHKYNVPDGGEVTDEQIAEMIKADVDAIATEQPWPAYRVDDGDLADAIRTVREKLSDGAPY